MPRSLTTSRPKNESKRCFANCYRVLLRLLDPTSFLEAAGASQERLRTRARSEEHTSELQSLMRISYAVFCLKKKKKIQHTNIHTKKHYRPNTSKYEYTTNIYIHRHKHMPTRYNN